MLNSDKRGASGYVFFAKNRVTDQEVAIKFYYGESGHTRHDEPRLLGLVQSPNVLRILDARVVSDDLAYFVTPRCKGGNLDDLIDSAPTAEDAVDLTLGVCAGVSAIHAAGLLHRDLKPANIVIEKGVPLIADFGSVRALPAGVDVIPASGHSILYRPPEAFDGGSYGRPGDIYQIGIIAYQLLGGSLPYDGTQYLGRQERATLATLTDTADRSIFVDECIKARVMSGSLLDFKTLPPWVDRSTVRVVKMMTVTDPSLRYYAVSQAAAALTRIGKLPKWRRIPGGARLEGRRQAVELHPVEGGNLFEAFVVRASGVRRAPGSKPATLQSLVKRFSC